MKKFICKYCGKEFESSAKLGGHVTHCKLNPNYNENLEKCKNNINAAHKCIKYDNIEYKCVYCGKICIGKNSLKQHEIRCKENPNKIKTTFTYSKPRKMTKPSWNKGLTKETDERVRKYSETISKKYKDGTNKVWSDGLTKDTDERIKKSAEIIKYTVTQKIQNNEWHCSFSKSRTHIYKGCSFHGKWEVSFAKYLDLKYINWERPKNNFEYIFENCKHFYTPDFYLPDFDLYIEIKGYPTDRDIIKWETLKKSHKLDIYFGDELNSLGLVDEFKNIYDSVPEKFRNKHLDLTKI